MHRASEVLLLFFKTPFEGLTKRENLIQTFLILQIHTDTVCTFFGRRVVHFPTTTLHIFSQALVKVSSLHWIVSPVSSVEQNCLLTVKLAPRWQLYISFLKTLFSCQHYIVRFLCSGVYTCESIFEKHISVVMKNTCLGQNGENFKFLMLAWPNSAPYPIFCPFSHFSLAMSQFLFAMPPYLLSSPTQVYDSDYLHRQPNFVSTLSLSRLCHNRGSETVKLSGLCRGCLQ